MLRTYVCRRVRLWEYRYRLVSAYRQATNSGIFYEDAILRDSHGSACQQRKRFHSFVDTL